MSPAQRLDRLRTCLRKVDYLRGEELKLSREALKELGDLRAILAELRDADREAADADGARRRLMAAPRWAEG